MASFVTKIRTTLAIPLTVEIEPPFAFGYGSSPFPLSIESNSVIATVTGGTAPYTYSWTYLSGATGFNCDTPSSATTKWFKNINAATLESSTWRVTVTDAVAAVITADITITLENFNYGI